MKCKIVTSLVFSHGVSLSQINFIAALHGQYCGAVSVAVDVLGIAATFHRKKIIYFPRQYPWHALVF